MVEATADQWHASPAIRYMCRGVENMPITLAGLTLPNTARLNLVHTSKTANAGDLVSFADISGKSGLLRQVTTPPPPAAAAAAHAHVLFTRHTHFTLFLDYIDVLVYSVDLTPHVFLFLPVSFRPRVSLRHFVAL
jgi:hypothetical protein